MIEKSVSKNSEKKVLLDVREVDKAFKKAQIIRKAFGNTLLAVTILLDAHLLETT